MDFVDIALCPEARRRKEWPVKVIAFRLSKLSQLITPMTDGGETVTLLKTRVEATLKTEGDVLLLTATGKKFIYALRIMRNCVHGTVRSRKQRGSRVRSTGCLGTVREVTEMLESIVCDAGPASSHN